MLNNTQNGIFCKNISALGSISFLRSALDEPDLARVLGLDDHGIVLAGIK